MARLFIAVSIPESVRANLARVGTAADVRGVKWVKPENFHLTLAFLGEVEERRVADAEEAAYVATEGYAEPLRLIAQGLGAFPNEERAKVLWAGLTGDVPALIAMRSSLAAELKRSGFTLEEKRFRPHITLARFRVPQRMPERLPRLQVFGEWPVTELQLIESHLQPAGARYVVRADIPLLDE
ncbi:MAG: RNA 2',3'-cyclic phosphodiesterase [Trueperaceae bacterium]|jgi:2'-5' RNA ligase|nr:RNA 2',3'-cyclic phosphodiesterase [Truepera sp.]HRN17504.1 RNA 2',3'-cyclic phosphodiesterase [Trueperaceae bacterium]